jgi:cyclophilin family peptidyl-prolyl cis-trans isomerase
VLRRLLSRWNRRPTQPIQTVYLTVESLEHREVPSVTLANIPDQQIPNNKPFFIPVSVLTTPNGAVTTTVSSNNSAVTAQVVTGGRSVQFDISGGTGSSAFNGKLTIRLFEDEAPMATKRIIDLINNGFYVGKTFHRIADLLDNNPAVDPTNVIVQGGSPNGDGIGGSTLPDFDDEFNKDFTFASNGLVAFANAGDDNNNSQFFITDLNRPLSQRIEFLNFNHTIFGILTNGFDLFNSIRNTPVNGTTPVSPVTITQARVLNPDTSNAVVKITTTAGFTGTASITINSADADGSTSGSFNVTGMADTVNSRPFLGAISDQVTTAGKAVTFTIPATDVDNDQLTYAVHNSDPGQADDFTKAPPNVNVNIDQTNGMATLTPVAGFTGSVKIKIGVRDQTDHAGKGLDAPDNFDTQVINLTVNAAPPPTVPPPPPPPPTGPITVQGSPAGGEPRVTVNNADGSVRFSVLAFAPSFTGGVRTALADVNNDGVQDVVAVPADGGAPIVETLNGNDGTMISSTTVFENSFRGGLFLDVQGTQALVGAGNTGGPRVTLMDLTTGKVIQNFFAGDPAFRGGVSVALGSLVSGKTTQQIVTGLGPGGGPLVSVFDASTASSAGPIGSFFAGPQDDRKGITVKVGDLNPTDNVKLIAVTSIGSGSTQTFDPEQFFDLKGIGTGSGSGSASG